MIKDGKIFVQIAAIFGARALMGFVLVYFAAMNSRAQEFPIAGVMSDPRFEQYFEQPYQQQIKSRISGTEAQEVSDNVWLIKQARIEKFDTDGKLQMVAEAPECLYDRGNAVAQSPGKLHIRSGNGQMQIDIDGEGFLWRQNDSSLTISNEVQTVIEKVPAVHP